METLVVAPNIERAWAWAHQIELDTPQMEFVREQHHAAYSIVETWNNKHTCVTHENLELGCRGVTVGTVYLHNKSWSLHNYQVAIRCLKPFTELDTGSDGEYMVFRGMMNA